MKTKRIISINDPVSDLLYEILGDRTLKAVKRLKKYRIETIGQLTGAILPSIPRLSKKDAKNKCITSSFLSAQKKRSPEFAILRLQRVLQIPKKDASRIFNACNNVPVQNQVYHFNSGWAFGALKQPLRITRNFWDNAPKIKVASGFWLIPDYNHTEPIYEQGERGTCVANATCTLLNYKTKWKWSRQFLYHQCKMIDNIPSKEGTYIETAMKIMSEESIVDCGNVKDFVWPYNPHNGSTKHQGPPPEKAFNSDRILTMTPVVYVHANKKTKDIKYLLNYREDGKTCPAVIGIPIYESFFSWSTSETGWVTMPLPGEVIVSYHAMIIVGYDEDRKLFLARNSWGPQWAHQNDKGYSGHAWIPYEYINKYCFVAASVISLHIKNFIIPDNERLYNKKISEVYSGRAAASEKTKQKPLRGRKRSITFAGWLVRIAVIMLLWHAYKEPINKVTQKIATFIKSNVDLPELSRSASDLWNEIIN